MSQEEVKANFERYNLLDDQVRFLPGWFKDTLQDAPIDQIAVLRLDGDLYNRRSKRSTRCTRDCRRAVSASLTTTTFPDVAKPSRTTY